MIFDKLCKLVTYINFTCRFGGCVSVSCHYLQTKNFHRPLSVESDRKQSKWIHSIAVVNLRHI
jgi:hypothetical protein